MVITTIIWATRSSTVGMPRGLVPPFALGISTSFTGLGKYVPELMRFHSLYRFMESFFSYCSMLMPSMPELPLFSFTFRNALCTAHLSITKGFASAICLLLVLQVEHKVSANTLPPSLHPHYKDFNTTT